MMSCNPTYTPDEMNQKLVGSLRYLCNSQPDIVYVVVIISRFMTEPRKSHILKAKRVM